MKISVIDPLSQAIGWAGNVLFRPFDIKKWFVLGFCAWLAQLGQGGGGGGGGNQLRGSHSPREIERGLHHAWDWVLANLLPILILAGFLIVVVLAIWLLILWLSSRGKFMFLDGVVNNRGRVVEPWHRFRALGNSLFVFRTVLTLIAVVVVISVLACGALSAILLESRGPEAFLVPFLIFIGLCLLTIGIVLALIALAVEDFLVPLMYKSSCGVVVAWQELRGLFSARPGSFILYVLVRIVVTILTVAIVVLACCLTCCIVVVPYIGTVILLPLWVTVRAYPLYFLGQFGPQYSRFATLGPEEMTAS